MIGLETKMPESCIWCDRFRRGCKYRDFEDYQTKRNPSCPLVEIITCKDCDNRCTGGLCTKHNITVTKDFYCADGEKKEQGLEIQTCVSEQQSQEDGPLIYVWPDDNSENIGRKEP